jgi:WD40 repeat protein
VRDLKTGEHVARWQGDGSRVKDLLFSPNGNHLAIVCEDKIHYWDWRENRKTRQLHQKDIAGLRFSPDGKWLAGIIHKEWLAGSIHKEAVRVWETAELTEVQRFNEPFRDNIFGIGGYYGHDVRSFPDSK